MKRIAAVAFYGFFGGWALLCFAGDLSARQSLAVLVADIVALIFMRLALRGRVGLRDGETAIALCYVLIGAALFLWLVPPIGSIKTWLVFGLWLPLVPIGTAARLLIEANTKWLIDKKAEDAFIQHMYGILAGFSFVTLLVAVGMGLFGHDGSMGISGNGYERGVRWFIVLSMSGGVLAFTASIGWAMAARHELKAAADAKIADPDELQRAGLTHEE